MTQHAPVPFYRPDLPDLDDYTALLSEIWDSRMLSNFSTFAGRLEGLVADYLGIEHALVIVSGDIGLISVLSALDLPPGSPCYLSTFTFNSTVNAAIWAGLDPVLVDIDASTFNLDPVDLERRLEAADRPGVILATHVFGNPCDAVALQSLADRHGCSLVFDAAHAYGSKAGDHACGTLGDAEVFSLSGTKLVTSAEGGLVTTRHDWLAEQVVYRRAYGFQHDYVSKYVGLNGKMSELHCALGLLTLATVEEAVARRHVLVDRYRAGLGDAVSWQAVRPDDRSTYKDLSVGLGAARGAVEAALGEAGIGTKRYFVPLHTMPLYAEYADGPLPAADAVYDATLCLPIYSSLGDDTIDRICEVVLGALGSR